MATFPVTGSAAPIAGPTAGGSTAYTAGPTSGGGSTASPTGGGPTTTVTPAPTSPLSSVVGAIGSIRGAVTGSIGSALGTSPTYIDPNAPPVDPPGVVDDGIPDPPTQVGPSTDAPLSLATPATIAYKPGEKPLVEIPKTTITPSTPIKTPTVEATA